MLTGGERSLAPTGNSKAPIGSLKVPAGNLRVPIGSLRVPADLTVTERAWMMFENDPGLYESVQTAIFRYFSVSIYVPGSVEEQFRSLLLGGIRSDLDVDVFALELHQVIGSYHLSGVSPVRILISLEEENKNNDYEVVVAVFPGITLDTVMLRVEKALQHAATERTKNCFTVSGIWSLGKSAFFGSENKTVEQAFFLFQLEKYEASLSLLFLGQGSSGLLPLSLCLSILCRQALGMDQEDTQIYEKQVVSQEQIASQQSTVSDFVDVLMLLAIRLLYLKLPKKEMAVEQRKKGCLALQMMMLECPLEPSLSVLLKKCSCALIDGVPSLAPLIPGLLMLQAKGLEMLQAGKLSEVQAKEPNMPEEGRREGVTEVFPFSECIEKIYDQAVTRSIHPEMRVCALAMLAGITSSTQRKKEILSQVVKVPGWVRYKRSLIKLVPEKNQVITISTSWSLRMSLVYPKDTNCAQLVVPNGSNCTQLHHSYMFARMKYVGDTCLGRKSRVVPGQTVRIRIGIKGMQPKKASLFLSGEEHAMSCNGKYVTVDVLVVGNRSFVLEYVIFLESGVFFRVDINKELEVLQIRYLLPRLQYRKHTPKWGICRIISEGCTSLSRGIWIDSVNGNKGYKKASQQRFFVRDSLGFIFLVRTPHVYTEEKKPKLRIKHFPNGKYAISTTYPLPLSKWSVYCISYRSQVSRITLTRLRAKKGTAQSPTLFLIPDSYTTRYLKNEDDIIPTDRPDTPVPEIEIGISNAFLGNQSRIHLKPLLQAVRDRFFRDDQVLWSRHSPESFTDITYYPPVVGTDPIILIRTKKNIMITRLPLEKRKIHNPYTLWSSWFFFHDVLHHRIPNGQNRIPNGQKSISVTPEKKAEGLLFYSLVTTDITTETKWFCKGLAIRWSCYNSATVTVCLINHSLFLHFVVILEMRTVHIRPLERIYHETNTEPENISITILPLE